MYAPFFITTPAPAEPLDAAEGRDENDERTLDLQPGQITMLEPGEEVQTSAPADSGQTYEPFPVPHAVASLGRAWSAICVSVERHAQGELLELAPGFA